MAEQVLRARVETLNVRVSSAGTYGQVGEPMTRRAIRIATALGVRPSDARHHRARCLTEFHLSGTDLVLTMTHAQSARLRLLAPALAASVFTVREFARWARAIPDDDFLAAAESAGADGHARARAALRLVSRRRDEVAPATTPHDEVVDAHRGSWATHRRAAAQLLPGVDQIARVLRLALETPQ
jgi:protein-tyrosine phosphatase